MEIEIYIYVYNALECTQQICLLIFKTWKIAVMFPGLLSGPVAWGFLLLLFLLKCVVFRFFILFVWFALCYLLSVILKI